MKKRLLLASTTLAFITGFGNCLGNTTTVNSPANLLAHDSPSGSTPHHSQTAPQERMHDHKVREIPAGQPIPSVDLIVHPDTMQGWNLEVKVSNFRFAPEKINQDGNSQEGHAHLYVNGKKLTRLYSSWYYLGNLEPGKHQITVTLNTNGHEDLVHNGQIIEDTEMIEVSATNN